MPPPMGDEGGDEDMDMGDDMGDEEAPDMGGDEDMPDDDMGDEEAPDMGGDEDMPDDGGDGVSDDVPPPPMAGKGKKGGLLGKTEKIRDGAHMMHKGASKMMKGMKEHAETCTCSKCKKSKKLMTKEEYEFWQSLQSQTGTTKFVKDEEGQWVAVEDAVIAPSDPNKDIVASEPSPGEVGYAPSGRVGALGTYAEWSQKYTDNAKKKNPTKAKEKPRKSWFM